MPAVTYRYQALKESLAAAITSSSSSPQAAADPRRPHALAVVSGLAANGYLASLLVARYARLGDPDAARGVFDAAAATSSSPPAAAPPKPLLYNAMLRAYLALGPPARGGRALPRHAPRLPAGPPHVPPRRHGLRARPAGPRARAPCRGRGRGRRARVRPPGGHGAGRDAR
ncbi:hypothetical protein C2845_PM18G09580 [Panicum miliaceum]|uniref:Pentatricopeptide repeat-containing protein n=1 Tax=Panicum miliaceum TaxID=4540 RepID=A0A3L6PJP8_PANMI|nr:hypothetical protein C2845_PM18G09580 [Panicum miliaceum]